MITIRASLSMYEAGSLLRRSQCPRRWRRSCQSLPNTRDRFLVGRGGRTGRRRRRPGGGWRARVIQKAEQVPATTTPRPAATDDPAGAPARSERVPDAIIIAGGVLCVAVGVAVIVAWFVRATAFL